MIPRTRLAVVLATAGLTLAAAGCGSDDSDSDSADTRRHELQHCRPGSHQEVPHRALGGAGHGDGEAQAAGRGVLTANAADFDHAQMLRDNRAEVEEVLAESKVAYRRANPAYEEMEGIVAGVSSLADYDVIIDAGSSGEDPENAVPFDLKLPNGETMKQPGNFMFLTETALYGTNDALLAKAESRRGRQRRGGLRRGASRREHLPGRHARFRPLRQGARRRGGRVRPPSRTPFRLW